MNRPLGRPLLLALCAAASAQDSRPAAGAASQREATITGRCVAAETGAPLVGVKATLRTWSRNSSDMALHAGEAATKVPDPAVTDAEGRFRFVFVPHGGSQYSLELATESRVPRSGRWSDLEPGTTDDLGDIAFALGFAVHGRVVDRDGKPVPKVGVNIGSLPLPIRPDMGANSMRGGLSRDDGTFSVDVALPPGTWPIEVHTPGFKLVKPDSVLVRKDKGADPLTVVVRQMPALTGTVFDETGQPVAGVLLQDETRAQAGRLAAGRSRQDGSFTIYAVDEVPEPTTLRVVDPGPCELPALDATRYAWGTTGIQLVLTRALTRELVVVAADTGAPVEEYVVRCHAAGESGMRHADLRLGGHHPGGRVTVDKVWRGENLLQVFPKDPSLVHLEELRLVAEGPQPEPLRVALVRRTAVAVKVVDSTGAPVPRTRVELIDPRGEAVEATGYAPEPHENTGFVNGYRGKLLVSWALTDADGGALLFMVPDSKGLVLRVKGPGHLARLHGRVPPDGGAQPIVIRVERGGTVAGTVQPTAVASLPLAICLANANPAAWRGAPRRLVDGRFHLVDLSAGEHWIEVVALMAPDPDVLVFQQTLVLRGCRTQVKVEEGKTTAVALDLSAYAPATVEGIVTLDGKPPDQARVMLVGRTADGMWRAGPFVPDEKGRFLATGVLPGNYTPQLRVGDLKVNAGTALGLDLEFELKPGERVLKELRFRRE